MTVNLIFRKRLPHNNSIEELFMGLVPFISKDVKVMISEMPYAGASPIIMFKNIMFARALKAQINHVTGDIHYLVLAFNSRSILTIHDVKSALQGNFFKQLYVKVFWFWLPALFVKRITVISDFTKVELEQIIPFAKRKIRVVHNPVNSNLKKTPYHFDSDCPKILFIGTKANKNLEYSLGAIRDLRCKAMIIGKLTEPQKKLLEEYQINYENKLNLSYDGIVECYQNCDLVCFASTYEGFGMPIIEAQAIGRPVITSNYGAMKEVSNGTACEVNPNDVASIRQGILNVFSDENFRQQLIENGLENVQRFQPARISKQYTELYKEIIG